MTFRIAVDTGGTFSDVVITDQAGALWVDKASTTPDRIFSGIAAALSHAARQRDRSLESLLGDTSLFIYGTTHATNAILTGRTARTAFLTTEGFPDTLVLREGGTLNAYDFTRAFPEPYIPKRLTFEIPERVDSEGQVRVPLDELAARRLIRGLRELDIEAVAVCFLWSIVNPVHEMRIGELLDEEMPGIPYTLSSQLNPIIREYRRASSTALDASLKPLMQGHFRDMANDLRSNGFDGQLLIVTSAGGVQTVEHISARPVHSVSSGPSLAPVAGRAYTRGQSNVIVCDMGGTSFDVSIVRDDHIKFTPETWLGDKFTGHITGLSTVDVKSIGAGGGSIAWIDSGGLLRVGPQSAGAAPGPACYGLGGTQPTVTDAAVVLGYIDPSYFLGGRVQLDKARSRAVIEEFVASPLDLDVQRAAWSIVTIANEHMVSAIREITINQGIDPRGATVVAGGGACGMTIARIIDDLGAERIFVPRTAGALSACGGLFSDIVADFAVMHRSDTNRFDRTAVNACLARLDDQMEAFFGRLQTDQSTRTKEFSVEARYPYQVWELEVPLAKGSFDRDDDIAAMVEAFHDVHRRVFAVCEPGQHIECVYWKARAIASLPKPIIAAMTDRPARPEPRAIGSCYFGDLSVETPRYLAQSLGPGHRLQGPAIVEEPTTTIVVYPGWILDVTETGDYVLTKELDSV